MKIEEVLQIKEQMMGDYSVQAVSARALHKALESAEDYSKWIRYQLRRFMMVFDVDYTEVRTAVDGGAVNGRIGTDHILPIDHAKVIAMMTKTEAGDKVRAYFLECEKQVQANTQHLIASTTQQSAIEDFTIINNLFTQQLINNGYSQGEIRKNTLLTGIEYEKKTGIKVLAPMLQLENTNGVNYIELSPYEGTHSALSEVAGTSILVTDIANRYKYVTSKMVNSELESLGYQRNHDNLGKKYYWVKTELSNLYAESGPLVSGPYKGLHVVKGWRFDPVKFPNFYNILHSRLLELEARLKNKYDKN